MISGKGIFIPKEAQKLLTEYAKNFDTVEIDNTFYRIPSRDTVKKWKEEVPDDFIFCAKFPRKITHIKMLQDCKEELDVFIEHMSLMGDKLGPLLLQLPPGFKPEKSEILKDFLDGLPEDADLRWKSGIKSGWMRNSMICSGTMESHLR